MEELQDYICIGQDNSQGDQRVVLFVKMKPNYKFTPEFAKKVQNQVLSQLTEEHVPAVVLEAKDIPVNAYFLKYLTFMCNFMEDKNTY